MAGEPDSNYGSYCLSTVQSSCSSISMSLNDTDIGVEDQPSTSGCSSEQPYTKKLALRKSRKEQVKRYLKELKGLVVQPSGNMGTLSALQQVVDTFKQIKENKESSSKLVKQENEFNLPFDEQNNLHSVCLNHEEALFFTVRYPDLNISAVSKNITEVLGYPQDDYLIGRDLCNFVHKKDIVTMNSSMSVHQDIQDEDGNSSDNNEGGGKLRIQKKLFYFRLRKYKALGSGFNLSAKETEFQTFQATVAHHSHVADPLHTKKDKLTVVLKCVPMRSAYEIEKIQNMTFSTRHNLFCSYSHIDSKAIPLLGFLPQDIVGMSIFDFYHPDDTELLYDIYQQVVNTETVPFKSPPFRFRVRNGDWVQVKTEWSRFVNPWSHRLEFVIGQHTVIKGPTRKNIFDPMLNEDMNMTLSDNVVRLKQMIRDLLLKPLVQVKKATPNQTIDKHRLEDLQWTESHTPVKEHSNTYVDDSNASSSVSTNRETLTYDHLNYTSNIKRFLLSQKNTIFSPFTEKKSGSSTEEEIQESSSCDSVLEVDISIPIPPSFGSSTKVLASEQEREESSIAAQLDSDLPTLPKNLMTVPRSSKPSSPCHVAGKEVEPKVVQQDKGKSFSMITLTQEVLWKHTRREETMFVEQAKEENSPMSFKLNGKRLHSLDPSSDNKWDIVRTIKIQKKQPGEKKKPESEEKPNPQATFGNLLCQPMFVPINSPGMPFVQVDPVSIPIKLTTATDMMTTAPSTTSNNMQWPYYPQSGVSFIPQVMGGFFQPGVGAFQPISKQNPNLTLQQARTVPLSMPCTTAVGVPQPMIHVPIPKKGHAAQQTQGYSAIPMEGVTGSVSSSQSSSMEETSSSLLYMLECDSPNRSSNSLEDADKPKRVEAPSWLSDIRWSFPVCMLYTMPKKKLSKTLQEDKEILNKWSPEEVLHTQMAMFEEELDQPPLLDMFEDDLFLMCPDTEAGDQMSSIGEDQTDASSNKTPIQDDSDLATIFNKEDEKLEENIENKEQKSTESSSGSSDRESLVDDDSCFSKYSDMTPSDERSVEEADSSLKESDESDVGCAARSFQSRIHDTPQKILDTRFKKFFAHLPIHFADSKKDGPPWMANSVVNLYTKMKYCISPKTVEKCLAEDRRKLQYMPQSDLIIEQLKSFIEDVSQFKGPGNISLKSSSQKQRNTYLRVPESLPVPHSGPSSESQRGRYSQIKHPGSSWQSSDLITDTLVKSMFPVEPGSSPIPVISLPMTVAGSASNLHPAEGNKEETWDDETMEL